MIEVGFSENTGENEIIKKILTGLITSTVFTIAATEANGQVAVENAMKRATAVVEKLESKEAPVLYMKIDTLEKEQVSPQASSLEAGLSYAGVTIRDSGSNSGQRYGDCR